MVFPKFCQFGNNELKSNQSASFCNLLKLHAQESQSILKYCYNFTLEALFPTNLERWNINLALEILMKTLFKDYWP